MIDTTTLLDVTTRSIVVAFGGITTVTLLYVIFMTWMTYKNYQRIHSIEQDIRTIKKQLVQP